MISLEEARTRINRDLIVLAIVDVPITAAREMVLAETVTASEAIPPFANTAMDGYAVRAVDTKGATKTSPKVLAVSATVPAGGVAPR
ncbi:MAG: molybdopterin molybdenumtransferase MoeA, partial [Acidimicrobiia bacterium]|nr:molybdopterin molybdenumtransferase MoeA [Acidimicrobiia bacterium]